MRAPVGTHIGTKAALRPPFHAMMGSGDPHIVRDMYNELNYTCADILYRIRHKCSGAMHVGVCVCASRAHIHLIIHLRYILYTYRIA